MRLTISIVAGVAIVVGIAIGSLAGFHVGRETGRHQRIAAFTHSVSTSGQEIPNAPLFALAMAERDTEAFVTRHYPDISVDILMTVGPCGVVTSGQTDEDFPIEVIRHFQSRLLEHMEFAVAAGTASNQFLHGTAGACPRVP